MLLVTNKRWTAWLSAAHRTGVEWIPSRCSLTSPVPTQRWPNRAPPMLADDFRRYSAVVTSLISHQTNERRCPSWCGHPRPACRGILLWITCWETHTGQSRSVVPLAKTSPLQGSSARGHTTLALSLIHISEPTRRTPISY